jgi:hypothetical protein
MADRVCALEGCEQPIPPEKSAGALYCSKPCRARASYRRNHTDGAKAPGTRWTWTPPPVPNAPPAPSRPPTPLPPSPAQLLRQALRDLRDDGYDFDMAWENALGELDPGASWVKVFDATEDTWRREYDEVPLGRLTEAQRGARSLMAGLGSMKSPVGA